MHVMIDRRIVLSRMQSTSALACISKSFT